MQVALTDVAEQKRQRLSDVRVDQSDCVPCKSADSRQGQRDIELQRRPVHAEHVGERFANAPQPLLRSDIHADRWFTAQLRSVEQIGEPVGLIVVGGQFHQQQPIALNGRTNPEMLAGERGGPAVDQFLAQLRHAVGIKGS